MVIIDIQAIGGLVTEKDINGKKGIGKIIVIMEIPGLRVNGNKYINFTSKLKYMTIKEQFDNAVLESKSLSQKPDNETLLQLYALYKQSTEGDVNTEPPSNMFDFVNKAKHEAWTALKGKFSEQAMEEYVGLVNKLKG